MQQEKFSRISAQNREICRILDSCPSMQCAESSQAGIQQTFVPRSVVLLIRRVWRLRHTAKKKHRRFLVTPFLGMTNEISICHSERSEESPTLRSSVRSGRAGTPEKRNAKGMHPSAFSDQSLNSSSLQGGISSACAISNSASTLGTAAAVSIF